MCKQIRFPGATYDGAATDLCPPIATYLECLGLAESDKEVTLFSTPESLQLIRAGATAFSKMWAIVLASGTLTSIFAFLAVEWGSAADVTRAAFLVGVAVLLSTVSVSIALIVRTDVSTRGTASAAKITARATAANVFLQMTSKQQAARLSETAAQRRLAEAKPAKDEAA